MKIQFSFLSALFIAAALLATFWVSRSLGISGEQLQLPLVQALAFSGFFTGGFTAAKLRRLAFKEGLLSVALLSLLPLAFWNHLTQLSTYGTSAAYFTALLFSAYMILILAVTLGSTLGYLLLGDGRLNFSFSYESWIGRRFLMAKRGSRAVSVITLISIIAVTMGCAGMIVVMSVMNGFSNDLKAKILGANAHLMVLKFSNDFSEYPSVIQKTNQLKSIVGVSPFVLNEVMVSSENNLTGAVIKGIDPKTVGNVSLLPQNIIDGKLTFLDDPTQIKKEEAKSKKTTYKRHSQVLKEMTEPSREVDGDLPLLPGIVIGKEMAKNLRVFMGDVVNVVSPVGELGPSGPIPKAKAFRVAGIFYSGMYEYDSKFAYIQLAEAQSFFGLKNSITGLEYKVDNIDHTQRAASEIQKLLGGYPYYAKDWMQMNRNLFSALKLEKITMFIILMTLILMASLLILVSLIMVVIEIG